MSLLCFVFFWQFPWHVMCDVHHNILTNDSKKHKDFYQKKTTQGFKTVMLLKNWRISWLPIGTTDLKHGTDRYLSWPPGYRLVPITFVHFCLSYYLFNFEFCLRKIDTRTTETSRHIVLALFIDYNTFWNHDSVISHPSRTDFGGCWRIQKLLGFLELHF